MSKQFLIFEKLDGLISIANSEGHEDRETWSEVKAARDLAEEWNASARADGFGGGAVKAHDLNRAMGAAIDALRSQEPKP